MRNDYDDIEVNQEMMSPERRCNIEYGVYYICKEYFRNRDVTTMDDVKRLVEDVLCELQEHFFDDEALLYSWVIMRDILTRQLYDREIEPRLTKEAGE